MAAATVALELPTRPKRGVRRRPGKGQSTNARRRRARMAHLINRDGPTCFWCGREFYTGQAFSRPTVDHIVPRAHGGSDALWNLVAACKVCNIEKGDNPATADWRYSVGQNDAENESGAERVRTKIHLKHGLKAGQEINTVLPETLTEIEAALGLDRGKRVEPGDERVLPDADARELDALPSRPVDRRFRP